MEDKKYYWIKLKKDFFGDDTPIDVMLGMPNGSDYVCLYLKLLLMTVNRGGRLCHEIGEAIIPYDIEKIARDTKFFSVDTVRVALELYKKLGLIYVESDGVLTMTELPNMIGSETKYAEKMRKYRSGLELKNDEVAGYIVAEDVADNVGYNVRQEIRDKSIENKSKRKDKDIEIDNTSSCSEPSFEAVIDIPLNSGVHYVSKTDYETYAECYPNVDIMSELRKMKAWCISNPTKRKTKSGVKRFINGWLSKEQDKPKPSQSGARHITDWNAI